MIVHVVLFRPKASLAESSRRAMFDALKAAVTEIPSVRRVEVGSRVTHGPAYEGMMKEDFPYAAIIEFDDLSGLKAYLEHPTHEKLGELFYQFQEAALVYDYEMSSLRTTTKSFLPN
jgi:hypothetical protein